MTNRTMAGCLCMLFAWAAQAHLPARADETADRIRKAEKDHQEALARLKAVLTIQIQAGGEEQSMESEIEVDIAAIDASGLFVGPDPKGLIPPQMQGGSGVEVNVSADHFTVLLADGKEAEAQLEGVDPETGLAFYRTTKPVRLAKALPLDKGRKLALGDPILILSRLTNAHPVVSMVLTRVSFVIDRPALVYGLNVTEAPLIGAGTAVFDLDGSVAGFVGILREAKADGPASQFQVVIPADRVAKLEKEIRAAQAKEREPVKETKPE